MTANERRRAGGRTPKRRSVVRAAVLAGAAVLVVAGCSGGSDAVDASAGGGYGFVQRAPGQDFVPIENRTTAPGLTGKSLDGASVDLASYRGKIVVVNFWASWCPPCRAETPELVDVAKQYPDVAFLGVNEKDAKSAAVAFVRGHDVPYPSVFDEIGTLAARWPVPLGPPSTFVLDREGRLAMRFSGGVLGGELRPVLDRVAAEPVR